MSVLQTIQALLPAASKGRSQGVDLSHWDGWFDPDKAAEPINFAITKLTEGTTWVDPKLQEIWQGVQEVPIRGGYHYLRSGMSWLKQAEHFLAIARPLDLHILAVDVEGKNNTVNDTFFADARRTIDYVRSKAPNRMVMLYTNKELYQKMYAAITRLYPQDGKAWMDAVPLWYAQYWYLWSVDKEPSLPAVRKSWQIWQITDQGKGSDWGTQSACDVNVFNGTPGEMADWLGLDVLPPIDPEPPDPPTEGDDFMAITDEAFKYFADQLYKGLHEVAEAVKTVDGGPGTGDGGGTTPPPADDDGRSTYVIRENDPNPNDMVKIYKSPDTNETNLETVWAKNGANKCTVFDSWEDVPGHPVWNSFSELDKINTYRDWRAIDCKATKYMVAAGGKTYAFPAEIRYNSGAVPEVVWIRKADLGAKVG